MATKKTKSNKSQPEKVSKTQTSYASLLYGVLTVLVLFAIVFLGIQLLSQRKSGVISDHAVKTEVTTNVQNKTYTVQEGDSLWTISEKVYNDGYMWVHVAEANKISNPDRIEKGMRLVMPNVTPTAVAVANPTPTVTVAPTPTAPAMQAGMTMTTGAKITGNTYTVTHGDNLWDISVRAYGNGYRWVEIAHANNLVNPGIIHSGNVFKLPR